MSARAFQREWRRSAQSAPTAQMFEMARSGDGGVGRVRGRFEELLRRGVHPAARNPAGDTPLHVASRCGNLAFVKALIDFDAPLRAENDAGETPLDVATPAVATHFKNNRIQLVLSAAKRGDLAGVRREIKLLCDNFGGSKRSRGIIALHASAAAGRQAEIVMDWALSLGVDIDAEDSKGRVALMLACGQGRVATVTKLLQLGARVNARDYSGHTARDYAMSCGQHSRLLEYIVRQHTVVGETVAATTAPMVKGLCTSIFELSGFRYSGHKMQRIRK